MKQGIIILSSLALKHSILAVVTVRYVQEQYSISRGAGSVRVCLTKDLQTASSLSVTIFTEDGTALSEYTSNTNNL